MQYEFRVDYQLEFLSELLWSCVDRFSLDDDIKNRCYELIEYINHKKYLNSEPDLSDLDFTDEYYVEVYED